MKKNILFLSISLIVISCDVEEGPFIEDYNSYVNPDKKVLIEDFTGHLCPNCPEAARELEAIHNIYGDQIIGIALHVTKSFAKPNYPSQTGFQYDFRTNWGDNWDAFYSISDAGLPKGMINRIGYQTQSHKLGKDEWAATVASELRKEIDFKINILADSNSITIESEVQKNNSASYNLVVCLTENNIINWQKDGVNNIENYEHNHVLRTVLLDDKLSNSDNYISGQKIEKEINYNLSILEQFNENYSENTAENGNGMAGDWNADNISVIAYIYNTITKEVVQVEEVHLNN